jgi:hypothetical protein
MANRKVLIESILGLAQKIGANPNKFMGTKQNINFLGTGDRGMKGTTFSGQLNDDFLNLGFGKDDMIKIIEQDAGYVTAGKLNDSQLNTMFNNLKMIDETFNPPPGPANIIDLETGTMNINKEGLESLRETDQIKRFTKGLGTSKTAMSNKIKEGIEGLKTKLKAPFNMRGAVDDIERVEKKAAEESFLKTGAANFEDSIEAEGARRAVLRQVLGKEPDFFMLPPEVTESIVKFKDLQRGGANAPDPLVVFRNIGNFTDKELKQIDFIIDQKLFEDTSVIADDVLEFIKKIRPEGFRPGFRSGKTVKGIAELLKLGKGQLKTADKIDRPASAKLSDEFKSFDKRRSEYGGPYSDDYYRKSLETEELVNVDELPIELLDTEALMVKYPGIPERLAKLIGEDTNLQRKAEAIAAIEQAMALKGAGKSADETIEILKRESKTKMAKGGLARILEM